MYDTSDFLGGRLKIMQPQKGYRAGSDAILVASAVTLKKDECLADMGAGVGAISLAVGYRFPENKIVGFELQEDLAALATQNAQHNTLTHLTFYAHDLQEKKLPSPLAWGSFDHVVTNPPYYEADYHTPSPHQGRAMARTGVCLFETWIKVAAKLLKHRGTLTFVYPTSRLADVLHTLNRYVFGAICIFPLWPKKNIPSKRMIIKAQKGSKESLTLLQGLILHEDDGQYTAAAEGILRQGESLTSLDSRGLF